MYDFGKSGKPADKMVKLFTDKLDAEGVKYRVNPDQPVVRLGYRGDNFEGLTFTFAFDDDGESVALRVFSIAKFDKEDLPHAYRFCSMMNMEYRWIKFYVDRDDEFTAAIDAVISPETAGEECYELLGRAVAIVDDVYGKLYS